MSPLRYVLFFEARDFFEVSLYCSIKQSVVVEKDSYQLKMLGICALWIVS